MRDDVHEFVELTIPLRQRVLQLFELAIDPAQLLVDLGQLERSELDRRSARTLSVTSVRWQRR